MTAVSHTPVINHDIKLILHKDLSSLPLKLISKSEGADAPPSPIKKDYAICSLFLLAFQEINV